MVSMIFPIEVCVSSISTLARPVARLMVAALIPGSLLKARSTRDVQDAQVMPSIPRSICFIMDVCCCYMTSIVKANIDRMLSAHLCTGVPESSMILRNNKNNISVIIKIYNYYKNKDQVYLEPQPILII